MKSITLIGSGNVATHLASALKNNYIIKQVFSRNLKNAEILSKKVNAEAINELEKLQHVDLIIVSLSDSITEHIINKLPKTNIVHTSGTININVFENKFENYGVLYPLQTFKKNLIINLTQTPICIEANNKTFEKDITSIAQSFSNNVISITSKKRKEIHLAAVFACNFTNHMFTIANQILDQSNIKFEILLPIIKQNIKNINNNRPIDIQTGPAKRKDQNIISEHLKQLSDIDLKEIYKIISQHITQTHD